MNLVSTLCSGVAAAANGWAELYIRGTPTRATWYADFEASTSNSSGDNIPLDAYGAVEVYVNQLVDVVAKSPDGTVIRSWTDGYSSPNIEVISPAFTGHDYVSGAAAVNKPTTLQAVLDLWEDNSGAPDWKVDVGGTDTTLVNAFGTTAGLVYNVKSPQYGAVGDGVVDDTAAISAAILAASLAGGGIVFFPCGTYLITTAIALDNFVSMVGVGCDKSIVTINSASARIFQLNSSVTVDSPMVIEGLTLQASQANAASQLYLGAADAKVLVRNCVFGGNSNSTGCGIEYNASTRLTVQGCWFNINSATLGAIQSGASATGSRVRVRDCTVVGPGPFNGHFFDLRDSFRVSVTGCMFDGSTNTTTGTHYAVTAGNVSSHHVIITGNDFYGGSFTAAVNITSDSVVTVSGNAFVGVTARYAVASTLGVGSFLELKPVSRASGSVASYTIPDQVELYELVSSNATQPTLTLPAMLYPGQRLSLIVVCTAGGGWASGPVTSGSSAIVNWSTAAVAVPNAAAFGTNLVVQDTTAGGTYVWRVVGP